jgi:XTP/dITP diphosphohydrolase
MKCSTQSPFTHNNTLMKLVIATKNAGKIGEIRSMLALPAEFEISSLLDYDNTPDVIEDGSSFHENAGKKAEAAAAHLGGPALADDSGIMIDALGGGPGVHSARYGGPHLSDGERNLLVLSRMRGVPPERRTARFVCVIAVALPDGTARFAEGECEGVIADEPRGVNGFGYDPIFLVPGLNRTMAELSPMEKNSISHRARALEKAREILCGLLPRC